MTWRQLLFILAAGILALVLYLGWSWQPERQVQNRFEDLIAALEKRNLKKVKALISPEYRDEWGLRPDDLVKLSDEMLRQFFWVEITPVEPRVTRTDRGVEVRTRLQLQGNGTALAQAALSRAGEWREPFVFVWRKESGKPWDWKLASMSQSELNLQAIPWE